MKGSFTRRRAGALPAATVVAWATAAVPQPATAAVTGPPPQAPSFDHVLHWNNFLLKAFRSAEKEKASPGRPARAAAMMNIAMHDANWPAAPRAYLPRITQRDPNDSIEATMDAAAHGVLKSPFPDFDFTPTLNAATGHNLTFTARIEDPYATVRERTFTSFAAATAEEDARSRVHLGVRYQWDADGGLESGFDLGEFVYITRRDQ